LTERRDEESDSSIAEQGVERSSSKQMILSTPFPCGSLLSSVFLVKLIFSLSNSIFSLTHTLLSAMLTPIGGIYPIYLPLRGQSRIPSTFVEPIFQDSNPNKA
jgi:hypothetical protein